MRINNVDVVGYLILGCWLIWEVFLYWVFEVHQECVCDWSFCPYQLIREGVNVDLLPGTSNLCHLVEQWLCCWTGDCNPVQFDDGR